MTQQIISLTESAAARVKELIAGSPQPVLGLRIGVKNGGCSGMTYALEFATETKDGEDVIEDKGVKIYVDPLASMFLVGLQMDYRQSQMGASFTFSNPNEKGRCGCGESFKV